MQITNANQRMQIKSTNANQRMQINKLATNLLKPVQFAKFFAHLHISFDQSLNLDVCQIVYLQFTFEQSFTSNLMQVKFETRVDPHQLGCFANLQIRFDEPFNPGLFKIAQIRFSLSISSIDKPLKWVDKLLNLSVDNKLTSGVDRQLKR